MATERHSDVNDMVIVAVDVRGREEALTVVEELLHLCRRFKVGYTLLCNVGFSIIDEFTAMGALVLLDIKLHDIPNTVFEASRSLAKKGIWGMTMHACGGFEMMRSCVNGALEGAKEASLEKPLSFAVTLLTSISQHQLNEELKVGAKPSEYVAAMAELAKSAGADGVVASGEELEVIRERCGDELLIVVPGIRPSWAAVEDQRRFTTPSEAIRRGANYIVVGRPILKAHNRIDALKRILDEIASSI
ncbi:MAG: hypothetical protein RUDDFDWM_001027 [Candidatus Fervidibacterota bacterium]